MADYIIRKLPFYNCSRCHWRGDELVYVGYTYHPPFGERLAHGQGVCPICHTIFQGCIHAEVYDRIVKREEEQ